MSCQSYNIIFQQGRRKDTLTLYPSGDGLQCWRVRFRLLLLINVSWKRDQIYQSDFHARDMNSRSLLQNREPTPGFAHLCPDHKDVGDDRGFFSAGKTGPAFEMSILGVWFTAQLRIPKPGQLPLSGVHQALCSH